jgi:hypothetical protein
VTAVAHRHRYSKRTQDMHDTPAATHACTHTRGQFPRLNSMISVRPDVCMHARECAGTSVRCKVDACRWCAEEHRHADAAVESCHLQQPPMRRDGQPKHQSRMLSAARVTSVGRSAADWRMDAAVGWR